VYQVNSWVTWQLRDVRRKFGSETWARDTRQQYHVATTPFTFIFFQKTITASLQSSLFEIADHRNVIVINHRQRHGKWEFNGQGPSTITLQRFSSPKGERCPSRQGGKKTLGCLDLPCFCYFFAKGQANGRSTMHAHLHLPWPVMRPFAGVQVP
jgi:hypothetical protein